MIINCNKCGLVFTKRTKSKEDRVCNKCKKVIKEFKIKHGAEIPKDATRSNFLMLHKGFDSFIKM